MSTSLLDSHLSQISLCSQSIASLPFPEPKIFTNALLNTPDITSLIRDTEAHERALFHLAAPPLPPSRSAGTSADLAASQVQHGNQRRATVYGGAARQPKNKAVAAVLGGDLYAKTRSKEGRTKGEIDVEVLLQGAEKLAAVYPIVGASERINKLRRRHEQLEANVKHYEAKVAFQQRELERMMRPSGGGFDEDDIDMADEDMAGDGAAEEVVIPMTKEDLQREEAELRELERKKRGLEERVEGMGRDLGGLMR